jgi:hypothetical protein
MEKVFCSFINSNLIYDLAIAIIGSYIFYLLNIYFPSKQKEKIALKSIENNILALITESYNLINYIYARCGYTEKSIPKESNLKIDAGFPSNKEIPINRIIKLKGGNSLIDPDYDSTDNKFLTFQLKKIEQNIIDILTLPILNSISDYDFISLIITIQKSEYLEILDVQLKNINTKYKGVQPNKDHRKEFIEFITNIEKLISKNVPNWNDENVTEIEIIESEK